MFALETCRSLCSKKFCTITSIGVLNFSKILFSQLLLFFMAVIKYAKAEFNPINLSRVIEYTT